MQAAAVKSDSIFRSQNCLFIVIPYLPAEVTDVLKQVQMSRGSL